MRWLSAVAGIDLIKHGTESDAETIKDTAIAQPLIVSAGLTALHALFDDPANSIPPGTAVGGHSVGEITAAAAADVITAEQAMVFVRERGRLMAEAASVTATGMSAVLGGDPEDVAQVLFRHGLTAANNNGSGQIVAAGTMEQLAALHADPPTKARVIPLSVAGAFHTGHMATAVTEMTPLARGISTRDSRLNLVSNRDGKVIRSGREFLNRLGSQISNPVRWDLCVQTFRDFGVTGLIEIPPAKALVNLAKRGLPGVEVLALKSPDQLSEAHRMIREHAVVGQIADAS